MYPFRYFWKKQNSSKFGHSLQPLPALLWLVLPFQKPLRPHESAEDELESHRHTRHCCCGEEAPVASDSARPQSRQAARQAPPAPGFSRQGHWSGPPLPSAMHGREKGRGSRSAVPDSSRPRGLQARSLGLSRQEDWTRALPCVNQPAGRKLRCNSELGLGFCDALQGWGFRGAQTVGKAPPLPRGRQASIPRSRRCPGEGNGSPLQYSCLENPGDGGAWWAAVHRVSRSRTRLSDFTSTFHFHALEKEMATHSSVLAWRIPGTGEPGGLQSTGSHRVGHDWLHFLTSEGWDWARGEADLRGRGCVYLRVDSCCCTAEINTTL